MYHYSLVPILQTHQMKRESGDFSYILSLVRNIALVLICNYLTFKLNINELFQAMDPVAHLFYLLNVYRDLISQNKTPIFNFYKL